MAKDKKQTAAAKADEMKDQSVEADAVKAETDTELVEQESAAGDDVKKVDNEATAEAVEVEAADEDPAERAADDNEVADEVTAESESETTDDDQESADDDKVDDDAKAESEDEDTDAVQESADGEETAEAENEAADDEQEATDDDKADDEAKAEAESKVADKDQKSVVEEVKAESESKATDDDRESADDDKADAVVEAKESHVAKEDDKPVATLNAAKVADKPAASAFKKLAGTATWRTRLIGAAAVGVLVGLGVGFGLAHLGQPSGTAVRTAYGNISSASVYNRIKHSQDAVMNVQSMIMEKSLEHDFPKAATDKKVNAQFNKLKRNKMSYYQELQQLGNDAAIKNNIRDSLLLEAAVAKNSKVSDAQVRAAYRTYRPAMTLAYVQVDSASRAKDVQQELAQATNYKDFADQVTNLHNQDSKHVSAGHLLPQFSSLADSQDVPSVIKKAAMKLHKGEVSPVVKVDSKTYVILYMKSDVKKSSYANDKHEIKKTLQRQEQTNAANRQKIMLKYAKRAHPKAVDASYKNLVKDMNQAAKHAE